MTDDPFLAHRSLLFTVAYELLGSAADAEDTVQETWLWWEDIGAQARIEVADARRDGQIGRLRPSDRAPGAVTRRGAPATDSGRPCRTTAGGRPLPHRLANR